MTNVLRTKFVWRNPSEPGSKGRADRREERRRDSRTDEAHRDAPRVSSTEDRWRGSRARDPDFRGLHERRRASLGIRPLARGLIDGMQQFLHPLVRGIGFRFR